MSVYVLNKMLRDINQNSEKRATYFSDPESFSAGYDLTADERKVFVSLDIGALYRLGVHGLILRPFTILRKMPEPDYLRAIRG